MQHLSPHLNEISAAMPHSKTPSRPLPGLSPPQAMTSVMGPTSSSKNAELQSSRAYLSSRAPLPHSHPITHHHLKSPIQSSPPIRKMPRPYRAAPPFRFLDVCSTRGCFSALSKSLTGSRLAAVTGRHLTHLLVHYVCPSREPLLSILNLPRGEDQRNT
jgi:hypothetical protein